MKQPYGSIDNWFVIVSLEAYAYDSNARATNFHNCALS